ncbi:MAG: class I SAM-dependent methyltransferase [Anaerolineaceae bacterium]|nr:class I SAM-dependent methyltransferase [Anaerolineaceae bacterium]
MSKGDLAALRGVPSYVWRDGQERRLKLIEKWAKLDGATVLEAGGGVGMYAAQIGKRYDAQVELFDIEWPFAAKASENTPHAIVAATESLPYRSNIFDTILSHEVIEHVADDRQTAREMVRVLKPGGRIVLFCPNRWYPFETHGHYWQGEYHFGNTPLINYLPDNLRNKLAPHVRAYTQRGIRALFADQNVKFIHQRRVYGAYDNLIYRLGKPMRVVRDTLQKLDGTPLDIWGLSHFLVIEKQA